MPDSFLSQESIIFSLFFFQIESGFGVVLISKKQSFLENFNFKSNFLSNVLRIISNLLFKYRSKGGMFSKRSGAICLFDFKVS